MERIGSPHGEGRSTAAPHGAGEDAHLQSPGCEQELRRMLSRDELDDRIRGHLAGRRPLPGLADGGPQVAQAAVAA